MGDGGRCGHDGSFKAVRLYSCRVFLFAVLEFVVASLLRIVSWISKANAIFLLSLGLALNHDSAMCEQYSLLASGTVTMAISQTLQEWS